MEKRKAERRNAVKGETKTIEWKPLLNAAIVFVSALFLYLASQLLHHL